MIQIIISIIGEIMNLVVEQSEFLYTITEPTYTQGEAIGLCTRHNAILASVTTVLEHNYLPRLSLIFY